LGFNLAKSSRRCLSPPLFSKISALPFVLFPCFVSFKSFSIIESFTEEDFSAARAALLVTRFGISTTSFAGWQPCPTGGARGSG